MVVTRADNSLMNAPSSTTTFRWAGYLWQGGSLTSRLSAAEGVGQDDVDVDFIKAWLAFYGSIS